MKFDPAVIARMTNEERREFARVLADIDDAPWQPLPPANEGDPPTPQQVAYDHDADVVGYGGAAGGGKTDLGIGLALTRHEKVQVFRREGTEITGIIDRMAEVLGHRNGLGGRPPIWRNPTKSCQIVEFCSVPNLGDERKFQGRDKDMLWFDEASNFLEMQVRFVMGWVRNVDPTKRKRVLLTFNPPTSAEGQWIVKFFAPWLDDMHPNPAKPGEIRWFAMVAGEEREVDGPEEFMVEGEVDPIKPMSRTFIPSRISDNPHLMGTNYMATLQAMPEPLRSQMLKGDFKAGMEDDRFQVVPTSWVDLAMARWRPRSPLPEQHSLGVDVAMGGRDRTIIMARCEGNWFEHPVVHKGATCTDAKKVASLILAEKRTEAVIHVDLFGVGAKPYGELMKLHQQVVGVNVGDPAPGVARDSGIQFKNLRSQLWWRIREELDPANNTGIALPPDTNLRADLCAPRFELKTNKIAVEGRDMIVKRIGRSPDYGSALGLALMDTPKVRVTRRLLAGHGDPLADRQLGGHDPYSGV